jgi:hypothetical protein
MSIQEEGVPYAAQLGAPQRNIRYDCPSRGMTIADGANNGGGF